MGAFGVALILGLNALVGYDLLHQRDETLVRAGEDSASLALVLERHATDSLSGVSKILAGVVEVLAVRTDSWNRGDTDVHALLRRQAALSPLIRAILVVSADGRLVHDTQTTEPAGIDLSDRDYLMAHRDGLAPGGADAVFVGNPVRGRTSGTWFISMSRRLTAPDGRFAGVAVAVMEPMAFRSFYQTLPLSGDAVITLYHADGPVIARFPDHDSFIGRSVRHLPLFTKLLAEARAGTLTLDSASDGPHRILSYRASDEMPLAVTVSSSRDAVLAHWWSKAMTLAAVDLAGTLVLAVMTLALLREAERRERALADLQDGERALRDSQQRLIQDIAARHRIEAELIAAKQVSDAANRAKTQFLANMSHELRTPLNAVIGFAEALESGIFGQMSAKQTEYVGDIRKSGQHLLSLINDILDTTKIESGKYVLHQEDLAVGELIGECLRQMEPLAVEKGVTLTATLPISLPVLHADARAVRQILLNLLSNAVKFTPPGGRIVVEADRAARSLRLRVSDTGIGIPAMELDQVMEPFHQVDNSHTRRYAGTGLGLPLVKSLVELQDGRFVLSSVLGRGTTATVLFPPSRLRSRPDDFLTPRRAQGQIQERTQTAPA
ncbi:ATP-binding protein [Azospirillum sp. TSH100]|uniref:sensor histidine kinase n=1 Tax=Azospirillum sp. TSH100 TaxID=652764 RepID=UPI000D65B110|nr:ATP-binding protein [Azospirillum sp. TSH100]QCG91515.1 sensor histidine kinase [Azospirillum sp. TSH100]